MSAEALISNKDPEYQCGEMLGPFRAFRKRIDAKMNSRQKMEITVPDIFGKIVHLETSAHPILQKIRPSSNPNCTNCIVIENDQGIEILITKNVEKFEYLMGVLIQEDNSLSSNISEELFDFKNFGELSRNLIFLPVAFHDSPQTTVKCIGPVHSIIPVAIGRNSKFVPSTPITLNSSNLIVPDNLTITTRQFSLNIPILDLDGREHRNCTPSSNSSTLDSPKSTDPEKPFVCTCGVAFSAEKTFEAHRQFYCKYSESSKNGTIDISRKIPEKCSYCKFQPVSTSQLSMHIRSAHTSTRTFTCTVCGYRAFSLRGIRTHMRSHSPDRSQQFNANAPEI